MTCDSLIMAYSGVALVAYMSTLTSLGYTATQYALLTSALTWTGKTLKGFSGVDRRSRSSTAAACSTPTRPSICYAAAIGLPAIGLCLGIDRPPRPSRSAPPAT